MIASSSRETERGPLDSGLRSSLIPGAARQPVVSRLRRRDPAAFRSRHHELSPKPRRDARIAAFNRGLGVRVSRRSSPPPWRFP